VESYRRMSYFICLVLNIFCSCVPYSTTRGKHRHVLMGFRVFSCLPFATKYYDLVVVCVTQIGCSAYVLRRSASDMRFVALLNTVAASNLPCVSS